LVAVATIAAGCGGDVKGGSAPNSVRLPFDVPTSSNAEDASPASPTSKLDTGAVVSDGALLPSASAAGQGVASVTTSAGVATAPMATTRPPPSEVLTLRSDGLGLVHFGDSYDRVLRSLTALLGLGTPNNDGMSECTWGDGFSWGPLHVLPARGEPRTFARWEYGDDIFRSTSQTPDTLRLQTSEGIGLGDSMVNVAKRPGFHPSDPSLGWEGGSTSGISIDATNGRVAWMSTGGDCSE
jgi:hypothetical protein